jgi:hypothetical protein
MPEFLRLQQEARRTDRLDSTNRFLSWLEDRREIQLPRPGAVFHPHHPFVIGVMWVMILQAIDSQ